MPQIMLPYLSLPFSSFLFYLCEAPPILEGPQILLTSLFGTLFCLVHLFMPIFPKDCKLLEKQRLSLIFNFYF